MTSRPRVSVWNNDLQPSEQSSEEGTNTFSTTKEETDSVPDKIVELENAQHESPQDRKMHAGCNVHGIQPPQRRMAQTNPQRRVREAAASRVGISSAGAPRPNLFQASCAFFS